jgi:hypothetical protein
VGHAEEVTTASERLNARREFAGIKPAILRGNWWRTQSTQTGLTEKKKEQGIYRENHIFLDGNKYRT